MTYEEFDYMVTLIEDKVRKQDTTMRKAISLREHLSLTLRFLATGESG